MEATLVDSPLVFEAYTLASDGKIVTTNRNRGRWRDGEELPAFYGPFLGFDAEEARMCGMQLDKGEPVKVRITLEILQ